MKNIEYTAVIVMIALLLTGTSFCLLIYKRDRKENVEEENRNKQYVCSMEPQFIHSEPGNCPVCGMALIEKKDYEENYADSTLNYIVRPVNESVMAKVRTTSPVRKELPQVIEASGIINYDRREVRTVSANFDGLIERSYVKYNFQPVKKGQKIFDIYCPEIYKDKYNYVLLLRKYPDQPEMTVDARNWMTQMGFTDEQIRQLSLSDKLEYHLTIYSETEGYAVGANFDPEKYTYEEETEGAPGGITSVTNPSIGLREGVVVSAGEALFKVINTRSVRADLRIRNEDAVYLRDGQNVILTDVTDPGRKFQATVSLIEPLNGGLFQLVQVYIPNKDNLLLPGMKIHARIEAGQRNSLWVPRSAVTDLGLHDAVFLFQDSIFLATTVTAGSQLGDLVEICSGIDEHATIASNASLLTDSDGLIITASKQN